MNVLDPRLTHFIVADRGEWGIGATLKEASAARPHSGKTKLSSSAVAYRVCEGTRITEEGQLAYPAGGPHPVMVDVVTGDVVL
jgi:hypothetical protein